VRPLSPNEERRSEASSRVPFKTPVETPAVSPSNPETPLARTAAGLKAAGYNAAVVARKLIEHHGATASDAEALTGRLFGKPVSAFAGDTTAAVVVGLACCALGFIGMGLLFGTFDRRFPSPRRLLLFVPLATIVAIGAKRIVFALVNRNVPPGEA
jgi:hypothetical protein